MLMSSKSHSSQLREAAAEAFLEDVDGKLMVSSGCQTRFFLRCSSFSQDCSLRSTARPHPNKRALQRCVAMTPGSGRVEPWRRSGVGRGVEPPVRPASATPPLRSSVSWNSSRASAWSPPTAARRQASGRPDQGRAGRPAPAASSSSWKVGGLMGVLSCRRQFRELV
jgi:hypothetical protein